MTDSVNPDFAGASKPTMHGNHIMAAPRVISIYWGSDYGAPDDPESFGRKLDDFFNAICPSAYFDLLQEFGVSKPVFLGSARLPFNGVSRQLDNSGIADTLKKWMDTGLLSLPDKHETNLLYMLFMPAQISLNPLDGKDGFHSSTGYQNDWFTDTNLFYAAIPLNPGMLTHTVCHEMVEAFTDRDGNGWHGDKTFDNGMKYEIGDVCEGPGLTFFNGYRVASFWSPQRDNCIQQQDLPPCDPGVTVTPTPSSSGFGTPTTFSVEAKTLWGDPISGKATIHESVKAHSRPITPSFSVPGTSAPIIKKPSNPIGPHGTGIPHEYYVTFTPDEHGLWNEVRISL